MQRTDISQCFTVISTNLIEAGKDYQCSVTLFVTVSFNCYCLPARFVDHINIREFRIYISVVGLEKLRTYFKSNY